MGVISKLKRLKDAIGVFKIAFRDGGIQSITINELSAGELLKGKNIVITGGGSGIGFAIARAALKQNANVIITGRNVDKLLADKKKLNHDHVFCLEWDITNITIAEQKILESENIFQAPIDVLVNNAGIQPQKFFPDVDETEWDNVYSTNSKGTFFICEAMCKCWMNEPARDYRKIINLSSQGGFVGATYPYRMSKWDIRGLTEGLGLQMADYGILVNGIAPGVVKTKMQAFSMKQGNNMYCNQNPLLRVALPEEIAELAVFMMSDSCNFMTGQTILVDGGFTLN